MSNGAKVGLIALGACLGIAVSTVFMAGGGWRAFTPEGTYAQDLKVGAYVVRVAEPEVGIVITETEEKDRPAVWNLPKVCVEALKGKARPTVVLYQNGDCSIR